VISSFCKGRADAGAANGGPTGLIFGLIVAVFYYSFIGLSLAEVRHASWAWAKQYKIATYKLT
jgi:hypothetical protein